MPELNQISCRWRTAPERTNMRIKAGIISLMLIMVPVWLAQASVIRDTEIEDGLNRIIAPMAQSAGLDPAKLNIRVVIDPQYNAFVLGDGTIYMHSGLLLKAEDVLEVAGVMAHEVGHIVSGHVQRRGETVADAGLASVLGAAAAIALTAAGSPDAAFGVISGGIDQRTRLILASSRQDEGVADALAIKLMQEQNLSLQPMATTMRKIASQRLLPQNRQSDYYLTHPGALERSAVFQDHVNRHEKTPPITPDWMRHIFARIQTKLEGWTGSPKSVLVNTIDKDDSASIYKFAIANYRLSNVKEAEIAMLKLIERHPDDTYYHEFYGDILLSQGRSADAAEQYEMSLERLDATVNQGQIRLSLGRAYMATGDDALLAKAVSHLEIAHEQEPEWAFAKRQLGIGYGKSGQISKADLTLAEEALMRGNEELAGQLARRVKDNPDATTTEKQLAADIIHQIGP
ncbi:MAG: Zn-dependent protease [Alphaproteobacteria bacterium]|nr:Zn-dependent protease [Alphaproteobacteria bacterium]